eukprot:376307-Karenia_brevis.AAC.1
MMKGFFDAINSWMKKDDDSLQPVDGHHPTVPCAPGRATPMRPRNSDDADGGLSAIVTANSISDRNWLGWTCSDG